jgi:hypothetical protein
MNVKEGGLWTSEDNHRVHDRGMMELSGACVNQVKREWMARKPVGKISQKDVEYRLQLVYSPPPDRLEKTK